MTDFEDIYLSLFFKQYIFDKQLALTNLYKSDIRLTFGGKSYYVYRN